MRHVRSTALLAAVLPFKLVAAPTEPVLEEVVVTATLRPVSLLQVPNSVTVLEQRSLRQAGRQHFEDVLSLVPNLNWAGGSSRPRYFQLRGIGEREQYEGAPNPSVGFLIDDIDFSGIGMPATLFDVKQIEVLRGPQGTRYGANALAGLIAVRSNDPEQELHYGAELSVADYDTRALGAYVTAPVASLDSAWRLSVQQYRSDGFRRNAYLNRNDTDGRNEFTGRFKWHWQIGADSTLDVTLLHADLDNGYDGWSIDNSRISLADKPGKDAQRATGASARLSTPLSAQITATVIASYLSSNSLNSFDGDWGNDASWSPYVYDYFQSSARQRRNKTLEWRLSSAPLVPQGGLAWLVGAYALQLDEQGSDDLFGRYADPGDPVFDDFSALRSDYAATNLAVYGQIDSYLAPRWRWSVGLRGEQRRAHYQDDALDSGAATDLRARNRMLGGQASLTHEWSDRANVYVSLARGYKAGGFNLDANVLPARRYFAPEYLWNAEAGVKLTTLDDRLYLDADAFYEWRRDMQLRTGQQADASDPLTYVFITSNVARGYNTGVEFSAQYLLTQRWQVGGTLGLLRTRASGALSDTGAPVPARAQAHAPEYTASMFALWRHAGWLARVDVSAKDKFYFDEPTDHDQQSHAYMLTNLKVGYEHLNWYAYAWASNVFNQDYAIRGFYFSNEPPFAANKLYTQKGEPRQVGITAGWKF